MLLALSSIKMEGRPMTLNEILTKLEEEIIALKKTISQSEFDDLSQKYQHFKESIIATSHALFEQLQQQLNEHEIQEKIDIATTHIENAFENFKQSLKQINEHYHLTITIEASLHSAKLSLVALLARFKDNYGSRYQSTVEALYHGLKAWMEAKPLNADIEQMKSVVKNQIKSIHAWIRKE